jgi:hypothetical protein
MSTKEELHIELAINIAKAVVAVCAMPDNDNRGELLVQLTQTLRLLNTPMFIVDPDDSWRSAVPSPYHRRP